jgi:hypothetical protein
MKTYNVEKNKMFIGSIELSDNLTEHQIKQEVKNRFCNQNVDCKLKIMADDGNVIFASCGKNTR